MPAKRTPKKSRTPKSTPGAGSPTPDLDRLTPRLPAEVARPLPVDVARPLPVDVARPLPVDVAPPLPVDVAPAPPKAGPPVSHGRAAAGRGNQRAAQPRRYAFRRS
ncbi:hypothetical protein AB0J20_23150 [Micromonospora costi]|uniref:hypothetical protein n=1 Tax=Micromonospora costi TaxID=1530042 RepID=UPI0033F76A6D